MNLLFSPRTFSKTRLVPEKSFLLNASSETGFISVVAKTSGLCVAELVISPLFDEQATRKTREIEDRRASIFFMNRVSRLAFGLNAILAWVGVLGSLTVDALGLVIVPQFGPSYFGGHADGLAGSIPRVIDNLSYFTIWSNILVAITTTMIYRNMNRSSQRLKVLRLSSLMMITVTMLVYILILAPDANPQSWNVYTNLLLHYITPPVTILVQSEIALGITGIEDSPVHPKDEQNMPFFQGRWSLFHGFDSPPQQDKGWPCGVLRRGVYQPDSRNFEWPESS